MRSWIRLSIETNILGFNDIVHSVVGDVPVDSACGDFINLEDLPAQSSKMLTGVGFAYVYS